MAIQISVHDVSKGKNFLQIGTFAIRIDDISYLSVDKKAGIYFKSISTNNLINITPFHLPAVPESYDLLAKLHDLLDGLTIWVQNVLFFKKHIVAIHWKETVVTIYSQRDLFPIEYATVAGAQAVYENIMKEID